MEIRTPAKGILTLVEKVIEQNQTIIDMNRRFVETFSRVSYIYDPQVLTDEEKESLETCLKT